MKDDYAALLCELRANPTAGADLGNGIRKVRMTIGSKGRGKSHGARVITVAVTVSEENAEINLLFLYDKAERDTLSAHDIQTLIEEAGLTAK